MDSDVFVCFTVIYKLKGCGLSLSTSLDLTRIRNILVLTLVVLRLNPLQKGVHVLGNMDVNIAIGYNLKFYSPKKIESIIYFIITDENNN